VWGLISVLAEAGKELELDSQHFEIDKQNIRFDDLTEIRWFIGRSGEADAMTSHASRNQERKRL
jgi:hypothetical protein